VFVGLTLLALTWNPVPRVKNRAPRGELLLKKFAGNRFGAEKASGTPSQLISRRPVGNVPPTPLLSPKKFLKAFTVFRISFGVTPDASNTSGSAEAATGLKMSVKPKVAIASESQCLFMIFMDCIGLIKVQVELLFADEMAAYGPKQARAGPGHAVEKAAAMDSVVFVVVRNVIGHNIGFWFGYLAGCLTPVFTDSAGFYSRYPSDQSASCGNFPQFLLCGCCFSTLVFAKTPRSDVGPQRGVWLVIGSSSPSR